MPGYPQQQRYIPYPPQPYPYFSYPYSQPGYMPYPQYPQFGGQPTFGFPQGVYHDANYPGNEEHFPEVIGQHPPPPAYRQQYTQETPFVPQYTADDNAFPSVVNADNVDDDDPEDGFQNVVAFPMGIRQTPPPPFEDATEPDSFGSVLHAEPEIQGFPGILSDDAPFQYQEAPASEFVPTFAPTPVQRQPDAVDPPPPRFAPKPIERSSEVVAPPPSRFAPKPIEKRSDSMESSRPAMEKRSESQDQLTPPVGFAPKMVERRPETPEATAPTPRRFAPRRINDASKPPLSVVPHASSDPIEKPPTLTVPAQKKFQAAPFNVLEQREQERAPVEREERPSAVKQPLFDPVRVEEPARVRPLPNTVGFNPQPISASFYVSRTPIPDFSRVIKPAQEPRISRRFT
jgi:hypothetical protein